MQRIVDLLRRSLLRRSLSATVTCLLLAPLAAQTPKTQDAPTPGLIGDVTCASDSSESYALYLPSTYTPSKRWPIIYFFDPGGRGRHPLDLYKDLADTYGFIFAGSNNSRNFASHESETVNAIWQDTHLWFPLDEHRTYASGFSGGARIAGAMALSCSTCQMAGVIAQGAGYPNSKPPGDHLLYFFAVGDRDFNWPEIMTARHEREDRGAPYRVRVFSGTHQWAPHDVMEDAMQWIILRAMQSGSLAPDAAFIDRIFQQRQTEADEAEKKKDALEEFNAYRSLVSDFTGLKDVGKPAAKLAALKDSPAMRAARKSEQDQVAEQLSLERSISPKLSQYLDGSAPDMNELRLDILQAMGGLKDQAAHSKNETKRLIASRAFDDMLVEGIENGQQELEAKHFEKAESCFQLMSQATNDPWPVLLLAETHAGSGNKKLAIKDLQEAIRRGLKDAEVIESDEKLAALRAEPEFQKLVASLR